MKIELHAKMLAIAVPLLLAISGAPGFARHFDGLSPFSSRTEPIISIDEDRSPTPQLPSPEVEQRRPSECYDNGVC